MPKIFRNNMNWHHDGPGGCKVVDPAGVDNHLVHNKDWGEALGLIEDDAGDRCGQCNWPDG